jgi:hypothetical protein
MASRNVKLKIVLDVKFEELRKIADDIGDLCLLIPESQHYEAQIITDRIVEGFRELLKIK